MDHLALQTSTEVIEPQRKKGKKSARHGSETTPARCPGACVQAGHAVAEGVLAVAGDAIRILQWGVATPAAVSTFDLATAMLHWAQQLHSMTPGHCLLGVQYTPWCIHSSSICLIEVRWYSCSCTGCMACGSVHLRTVMSCASCLSKPCSMLGFLPSDLAALLIDADMCPFMMLPCALL